MARSVDWSLELQWFGGSLQNIALTCFIFATEVTRVTRMNQSCIKCPDLKQHVVKKKKKVVKKKKKVVKKKKKDGEVLTIMLHILFLKRNWMMWSVGIKSEGKIFPLCEFSYHILLQQVSRVPPFFFNLKRIWGTVHILRSFCLNLEWHSTSPKRLFVDCSKRSLKSVLLQNSNMFTSVASLSRLNWRRNISG